MVTTRLYRNEVNIGMEYSQSNNCAVAEKYVLRALDMWCPGDPFVLHELGLVHFANSRSVNQ